MRIHYPLLIIAAIFMSCSDLTATKDPIPNHDSFTINSSEMGEVRTINVWVPDAYKASQDSLAVMYMADGGIKEDFRHIANTLGKLAKENKIAPLILVEIENTERRRDLTGFTEVDQFRETVEYPMAICRLT
ncbi:alpha/beta hydrolase-fold protein [Sphingobacterium sp.]|uniref:alpha/beta hydrolase-fold protein n=1 Tax=Sphingobacterium sp. TaxID=341027 RepID=UPI00289B2A38|nr:alpha/beta hydrolase-fold protein [Sphingobacterium sp.]